MTTNRQHRRDEIEQLIKNHLAVSVHASVDNIDTHKSFNEFGLNSVDAVGMSGEISDELHQDIPPTAFWEHNNVEQLTDYILKIEGHSASECPDAVVPAPTNMINPASDQLIVSPVTGASMPHNLFPEIIQYAHLRERILKQSGEPLYFSISEQLQREATRRHVQFSNFSSYNYLGFAQDESIKQATIQAIHEYGTCVSASRVAGGEKFIHLELEAEISRYLGVEDAIVFNSGHATNVTTIGHVMKQNDLILCDELCHNSIMQGAKLSQATTIKFKHNNLIHLAQILEESHERYQRIMIIVEGLYSMDGDIPPLPQLLELKKQYQTLLYIDEAHSLGVLGDTGRGITELFHVDPNQVDFLMGTLGKALGAIGGYIAGSKPLIDYLKSTAPGFVYSLGLSPAQTATALASLRKLIQEPTRPQALRAKSSQFINKLRDAGLNCGVAQGVPIVPIILGASDKTIQKCAELRRQGIFAQAIIYPAVEDAAARIRFFLNVTHTEEELERSASVIISVLEK